MSGVLARRPRAQLAVAALAALLAGCADPVVDRGQSPPVVLSAATVAVRLASTAHGPAFASAIRSLGGTRALNAIRASVGVNRRDRFEAVRAELLAAGIEPDRIRVSDQPDNQVVFTRTQAYVADCRDAIALGPTGDASQSFQSVAECEQARTLAGSVADPADLAAPPAPGLADGAKAAGAVLRWQGNVARPASAGGGDGGGSGQSGIGAIPTPAAAGLDGAAGTANPLTSLAPLQGAPVLPPSLNAPPASAE